MQAIIYLLKFIALLFTTGILVSCGSGNATPAAESSVPVNQPRIPVDIAILAEKSVEQSEIIAGSVIPNREVQVMSELSRKIVAVAFKDGGYVRKGQPLYKLDDADIKAKIRQLQAELNLALINESRLKQLLKSEAVRQEEYDGAFAKLEMLKATEDLLKVELEKTRIPAPFSGSIGINKAHVGSLVTPGTPLVNLIEQNPVKIRFSIPEKYSDIVKPGKKILFTTEFGTNKEQATIIAVEPLVEMSSRNVTVEAIAKNEKGKEVLHLEAKNVSKNSVSNDVFQAPAGYQIIDQRALELGDEPEEQ